MKLESIALHSGYEAEATTNAAAVPIYQTTSYTFNDTQHGADLFDLKVAGNIYTRIMNPTTAVLEQRLTEMEGGIGALAVSSGMAAITYAVECIAASGDNIVSTSQLYGGTYNFFAHSLPRQGIETRFFHHDDYEALENHIDDKTRAIVMESIGTRLATSSILPKSPKLPTATGFQSSSTIRWPHLIYAGPLNTVPILSFTR